MCAIRALRSKVDRTSAWPALAHLSLSPHGKSTLMMYSSIYWINAGLPLEKLHDTADTRSRRSLKTLWRSTVTGLSENRHLRTVEIFSPLDGSVAGMAVRALSQRFEMICHTNVNERLLIWMRSALKGSDLDVIARRSPAVALSFPSLRRTARVHWFSTL